MLSSVSKKNNYMAITIWFILGLTKFQPVDELCLIHRQETYYFFFKMNKMKFLLILIHFLISSLFYSDKYIHTIFMAPLKLFKFLNLPIKNINRWSLVLYDELCLALVYLSCYQCLLNIFINLVHIFNVYTAYLVNFYTYCLLHS